jgi:hypothetical protein
MRSASFTLTALLTFALTNTASPALASSSEVFDASDVTPAHVDIVHAKVTQQVGRGELLFMMELAATVPNPPVDAFVAYNFQLDTDPATPLGQLFEYVVIVRWLGGQWQTLLNDASAVPSGGTLVTRPIERGATFDGATVKVRLDPARYGIPESFTWRPLTRLVISPAPFTDAGPFGEFTQKS